MVWSRLQDALGKLKKEDANHRRLHPYSSWFSSWDGREAMLGGITEGLVTLHCDYDVSATEIPV